MQKLPNRKNIMQFIYHYSKRYVSQYYFEKMLKNLIVV
jgi:hypothetical protein